MAPTPAILPAQWAYSADGVPYSAAYDDVYHSWDGGLGQARWVFLGGNGLPARWRGREQLTIVETGFGLGLNFLATWAAWRADPQACQRLHFVSVEKHPFTAADLAVLHGRWPEFADLSRDLLAQWPPLVPGFHRLHLDGGRVSLTLMFGDALDCLPQLNAAADAFYLDGFSPAKNPDLWSPPLFHAIKRLAAAGATAATYTVAAAVRQALKSVGFQCEKRPGFGGKRDMLGAWLHPSVPRPSPAAVGQRRAIVIGAGIAGSSACLSLAQRGWQVALIERQDAPGREASGNHAGVLLPMLSRDDNRASRFSRAAFLYALRRLASLPLPWGQTGVLQLAKNADQAQLQRLSLAELALPADFARYLDADAVDLLLGRPLGVGGVLFPQGGWAHPPGVCAGLLAACGEQLRSHFLRNTARLAQVDGGWQVLADDGRVIAEAPRVIIAAGSGALAFDQCRDLPLRAIRGQVSHLPEADFPAPALVICREGYVTPAVDGTACVGATFDVGDTDPALRLADHQHNLAYLERLLPGAGCHLQAHKLSGKVGLRPASLDRLPLVGALPRYDLPQSASRLRDIARWPGLYGLLGYGSRGLVWAGLAAEILAASLENEPMPVETELLEALDPARFILRARRTAAPG